MYPKRVITDGGPTFGNDFKQYVEYHYDSNLINKNDKETKESYELYMKNVLAKTKRKVQKTKYIYGSPNSPTSQSHIERAHNTQKSLRDRIKRH